jgi:hypothetical protein
MSSSGIPSVVTPGVVLSVKGQSSRVVATATSNKQQHASSHHHIANAMTSNLTPTNRNNQAYISAPLSPGINGISSPLMSPATLPMGGSPRMPLPNSIHSPVPSRAFPNDNYHLQNGASSLISPRHIESSGGFSLASTPVAAHGPLPRCLSIMHIGSFV